MLATINLYFTIFKYSTLKFLVYPIEVVSAVVQRILEIVFLIVFWNVVIKSNQGGDLDTSFNFIGYFLIAGGITELNMTRYFNFGNGLARLNQKGQLSSYLIKPLNILSTYYVTTVGERLVHMTIGIISILLGVISLKIHLLQIILFLISLFCSIGIGVGINLFIANLAFYIVEVFSVRAVITNIVRVFSGYLIPLSFIPIGVYKIMLLTPIPYLISEPFKVLSSHEINNEILQSLAISIFWCVLLNSLMVILWKRNLKTYESVGI